MSVRSGRCERLSVDELQEPGRLSSLLRRAGFAIVRADSRVAGLMQRLETRLDGWWDGTSVESRRACSSTALYRLETGSPAWFIGHQEGGGGYREAFRVPTAKAEKAVWPAEAGFEVAWRDAAAALQGVADMALAAVLAAPGSDDAECASSVGPSDDDDDGGRGCARFRPLHCNSSVCAACWRLRRSCSGRADAGWGIDDDLSVMHALRYKNSDGVEAPGQGDGLNVAAHFDESLVVVSPVARVPGLEVQVDGQWVSVEEMAGVEPWTDMVVFAGRRLQHVTKDAVPALWHRVRRADQKRTVVLFEQKYADFYPLPEWDE